MYFTILLKMLNSFNFIIHSIKHGHTICGVIPSMTLWGWRRISSWIQAQVHHPSVSSLLQKEQKVLMKAVTGNLSVVWGSYCRKKKCHEEKFIRGARSVFI